MITLYCRRITLLGLFAWSLLAMSSSLAQAQMTNPDGPGIRPQVRLVHGASADLYGMGISPSLQEEILQEIRLYQALDALIQQLKIEIQMEGEGDEAEIKLEIPTDMNQPQGNLPPLLHLEFEILPDSH